MGGSHHGPHGQYHSLQTSGSLYAAIQTADSTPSGAHFDELKHAEFGFESSYDTNYFTTPAGHLGGGTSSTSISTALVGISGQLPVTVTAANSFTSGQSVTITSNAPAGFNGTYVVTSATANSFAYTDPASGLATATSQATGGHRSAGGITYLAATGDSGARIGLPRSRRNIRRRQPT